MHANPVCSTKNYREALFSAVPSLKALDGHRKNIGVIYPYEAETDGDDNLEYKVDEDWYKPEIYKSNIASTLFVVSAQTSKEE